jgi:hypothetical protein
MRRVLFYVLLALAGSGLCNAWIAFRESASPDYYWGDWLAATVFGIAFQELVATRLPVSKQYYRSESKNDIPNQGCANSVCTDGGRCCGGVRIFPWVG